MKKKLNFGVISCGSMGRAHMEAVAKNPRTNLSAICDIDKEKLEKAAADFEVEKTALDYRVLLEDKTIDAVIIASPDQTHKEATLAALEAGKHALCEKPMALTIEDCREMVDAARKARTKTMIGQICRYAPGFRAAKDLIDRGEIGELFFIETEYAHDYSKLDAPWRLDPLRHGFLGGGCHAVDLARWIAGDPIETTAYSNHKTLKGWPTDDCTIAIMRFPNDAIGKAFVSTGCKRDYTMRSAFYGTKGTIITDNTSVSMTVFKEGLGDGGTLFGDLPQSFAIPVQYPLEVDSHNAGAELDEFADCIANDKEILTTALEGAKTVAVCLAVVESAKTGGPVKIKYDF